MQWDLKHREEVPTEEMSDVSVETSDDSEDDDCTRIDRYLHKFEEGKLQLRERTKDHFDCPFCKR